MGEFYRDYFVRRKAPWLCGRWDAVYGDRNHRKSLGKADLPGTPNGSMGKTNFQGPCGGHCYHTFHDVLFHTTKGKTLRTPAGVKKSTLPPALLPEEELAHRTKASPLSISTDFPRQFISSTRLAYIYQCCSTEHSAVMKMLYIQGGAKVVLQF